MSRISSAFIAPHNLHTPLRLLACAVLATGALATALCVGTAAASNVSFAQLSRARRCLPPHRQVLRRSGAAVLFLRQTGLDDGKYGAPHSLYGCAGSRQAPVDLFDFEDGDTPSVTVTAFAGSYAAFFLGWEAATCVFYENAGGSENCGQTLFESVNLKTGRIRLAVEEAEPLPTPGSLVVTRRGWIAWTAPDTSGTVKLLAHDAKGARTLDPGPVDTRSLKVSGETVRWTDAGVARVAILA